MARRRRHEEHQNHEAWAIPYGDLVTLLLAFFVVMYAISTLNEGKYRVVSAALSAAFHGTDVGTDELQAGGMPTPIPSTPSEHVRRLVEQGLPMNLSSQDARGSAHQQRTQPVPLTPAEQEAARRAIEQEQRLNSMQTSIGGAMADLMHTNVVSMHRRGNNLEVQISADMLFPSGSAQLMPRALEVLRRLSNVLRPFPETLRVEGHTDDVPIRTAQFPSNWELSAARAASVVHLFMDQGIDPRRLAVMGMSQYTPLATNATAEGRSSNRRVTVLVVGDQGPQDASPSPAAESALP